MIILCIDASLGFATVNLFKEKKLISAGNIYHKNMQAERLVLLIENLLKNAGKRYEDIDYIAVTKGPGSFTGIRVGLSAVCGITAAIPNITPVVIDNFCLLQHSVQYYFTDFAYSVVTIYAGINRYYMQIFKNNGEKVTNAALCTNEQVIKSRAEFANKGTTVHIGHINKELTNNVDNVVFLPRISRPNNYNIGRYAYHLISQQKFSSKIEAMYIQPPSAEKFLKT